MNWIEEFRADGEDRLARLARDIDASGEAASAALDFSRDSLVLVWSWLLPRLSLRRLGDELDAAAQPPWWHRREHYQPSYWDDATIDRAGAVAYYVGETLVRRDADASWAYSDRKDDSEAGEALIHFADSGSWWNPLVLVLKLLRAARDGESSRTALADACDPTPARPSAPRLRGAD